jgi:two-component system, OmpR family, osmolarity sensor histidine kinase EnvZ
VWDHGAGMSAPDFERAKRPFVRLGPALHGAEHCGLGLAIVEQVAAQTGASLALMNDPRGRFGIAMVWPVGSGTATKATSFAVTPEPVLQPAHPWG